MAQEPNPVLTGGNGVHQFFSISGYVDSTSGCEDQDPDNPNIKPGRDHTFTVIGNMWLENGKLQTDGPATGVLHRDGSFHLDYPRVGPSALRAIDGRIGAPNPGGLDAPITGTWTAPYPNGTSTCLTHWVITSGRVNLTQGGFGVPLTRAKTQDSDHGGGVPLVPIGAGVVALFGIGGLLTWVKTRPRHCDCDFTVTIEGPNTVEFCDCVPDEHWFLEYLPKFPGSKEYPEDWRKLGVATPGDPAKSTELGAAKYHARVSAKCTGAGTVEETDYTWTLSSPTVDATDRKRRGKIEVAVRATIKCPNTAAKQLSRAGQVAFEPKAECCGPDFTDAYVAALNRVVERIPLEFPADKRIAQIRWFEKNGPFMMVRPFGDLRTVGDAAAGCPSNDDCVNTATLLGRCVDLWCTDGVVWGVVTGRAGMKDWQRDALGLFAKVFRPGNTMYWGHVVESAERALTRTQKFWEIGHKIGAAARDNSHYRLDRSSALLRQIADLASDSDIRLTTHDCRPCTKKPNVSEMRDWSLMDWKNPSRDFKQVYPR